MILRIVVADEGEARLYDLAGHELLLLHTITDPKARWHDRDFKSDRPGRVFDHAATAGARRGGVGHHSTGGGQSPREHETQLFARSIGASLEQDHSRGGFDRLVLVAAPRFLGALRAELPPALHTLLAAEIHKDLVHQSDEVLREHLHAALER